MIRHTYDWSRSRTALVASLAGLLVVLLGCADTDVRTNTERSPAAGQDPLPVTPPTPTRSPARPDRSQPSRVPAAATTVKLSFGGDVMFEDDLRDLLEEPERGLAPIRTATAAADFTMVNLESAVTTRGARDPKELEDADNRYHFRTSPDALTALQSAGVDAVSVANNHGADFGADGLADTLQARSRSTMPVLGVGRNRAEAFAPHQVTLKGQSFAFFAADASFLESTEPYWQAGTTTPGLAAARGAGRSALLTAVGRSAARGTAVVVYLHWGRENSTAVTADQRVLAGALARAGAAAVVGTHTHRLQGAGWMRNTYVAYGLGNFIWYHGTGGDTGLLDLTVREGRVVADGFRPALIPADGGLPRFLRGRSAAEATLNWRTLRRGSGLAAAPPQEAGSPPVFSASAGRITANIRRRMASSYANGCPVPLDDLRYLRVSHWDFNGRVQQGELVVAAKHADALVVVFRKLYAAKFPIQRMRLVSDYGGDDERSMAANNTSAFNCRTVAGTSRWSQHSFGAAVDLNPIQNPYVTRVGVSPTAGKPYAGSGDRRATVQGLITADSAVVRAFREGGWEWGGDWSSPKDYQHFSAAGS